MYCRSLQSDGRTHTKFSRPSEARWVEIGDLEGDRQFQFWATAVTDAGEGMSSNVVTQNTGGTGRFF